MNDEQLNQFRQRLLDERARLTENKEDLPIDEPNEELEEFGATNHPADAATEVFLRERNVTLNNNADELVGEIDAALARIENGTYGICERTGQQIPIERLEALPYARYTIEGQREVEQERGL